MSEVNHSGDLDHIVFSPNGERYALVTSIYDRSVEKYRVRLRLHDTVSGKMLFARPLEDKIRLLAFSSDGERLATVDEGSQLSVWTVP
jgi:WD40 repeat protein